jgi:dipeptidyl aminopeptidase/acylaminoacyl peptidase
MAQLSRSLMDKVRTVFTMPIEPRKPASSLSMRRLLSLLLVALIWPAICHSTHEKRRFTVADDIGLSHFGDPYTVQAEPITFSPNGEFFVVDTERGRMDINRPESTLRVYRTASIGRFLQSSSNGKEPAAVWTFAKSSYRDGPIIKNIQWLSDSKGFAFLAKTSVGKDQLFLADLSTKNILTLTPGDQQVTSFDIRDRSHYVYCIQSPETRQAEIRENRSAAIPARGHTIYDLLFGASGELRFTTLAGYDVSELWAVVDGRRFLVRNRSGQPIPIRFDGQMALALSPDGQSVVTALTVNDVPQEWVAMYPSAYPSGAYSIKAGHQDPVARNQSGSVSEYAAVDLSSGRVARLTRAPVGNAAGWWADLKAAWSSDGKFVVLPNTFIPPDPGQDGTNASAPCTAVVEIRRLDISCVARLPGQPTSSSDEKSLRMIVGASFFRGTDARVAIRYLLPDGSKKSEYHSRERDGSWSLESGAFEEHAVRRPAVDVFITQDLNSPPRLMGTDHATGEAKILWDPNPQLKRISLGEESVFRWKDDTGRDWIGGLYKPPDFEPGRRYPLVIQTHGFRPRSFNPSGIYPTAFAAQELAAAEIVVLQIDDCPIRLTTEEASCQVSGYESAVKELAAAGVIDPDRVGIIGFSRTCYYVMQALTDAKLHLRAASITDGIVLGYVEYIMDWEGESNDVGRDTDILMGAPPFGKGLEKWLKNSPEFNLDRVASPLQIVVRGRPGLLSLWEPYAGLNYLHKPVDLILLPDAGTHPLTNPAQRAVSQTGTVDWFRFWLNDEVDPEPRKRAQYDRWRALRDLEQAKSGEHAVDSASPHGTE